MTTKSEKQNEEVRLPDGVSLEMVKAWKERYGHTKIKLATLNAPDGEFEPFDVVMRVPDRIAMGEFEKYLDKNPNKAKEIILKACLLTKKDEVLANDDMFLAAFNALAEILPVAKSEIKNL